MEGKTALHSGDMGDIIYSIPVLKHLGVTKIYLNATRAHGTKFDNLNAELIKGLMETQGFEVEITLVPNLFVIDYNMDDFRRMGYNLNSKHLATFHAEAQGLGTTELPDAEEEKTVDLTKPYIKVYEPKEIAEIVINRSDRYKNKDFDWNYLLKGISSWGLQNNCDSVPQLKRARIIFIGLKGEYDRFCKQTMLQNVSYYPTNDLYEAARVIAGCKVYIGNQSSPFAIAEGLKANRILECCDYARNSDPQSENTVQVLTRQDLYYAKLKLYEWLGLPTENIAEPITEKVLLFTTGYINSDYSLKRMQEWVDFYGKQLDKLGATHCVIIDDCSDEEWIDKLKNVEKIDIKYTRDEHGKFQGILIDAIDLKPGRVTWMRFNEHSGRPRPWLFPGWWRSYSFGGGMLAAHYKFDKFIFIESDAYIFTDRLFNYLRHAKEGYGSMWCPGDKIRETSIQWCMASEFYRIQKYWAIDGVLNEDFWWSKDMNRYLYTPEFTLPFTNDTEEVKQFLGDRYGDDTRQQGIFPDADFACNMTDISLNFQLHQNEEWKLRQLKSIMEKCVEC